jgi:hypothetical protein
MKLSFKDKIYLMSIMKIFKISKNNAKIKIKSFYCNLLKMRESINQNSVILKKKEIDF